MAETFIPNEEVRSAFVRAVRMEGFADMVFLPRHASGKPALVVDFHIYHNASKEAAEIE